MKIRLLTDTAEWGGTEVHVLQLVQTLAARGHDVAIAELGRPAYSRTLHQLDPRVKVLDLSGDMSRELPRRPRWAASRRLAAAFSADVCILVKGFIDVGTWQLDLLTRLCAPRYLTIEHLTCPMPPKSSQRHWGGLLPGLGVWWYRQRARRILRGLSPHRVICVSDAVRQELSGGYSFPKRKLVTVRNGIDVSVFSRDEAARRRLRQGWGATADSLVFGAVGRLSGMKNYQVAVESFARLTRELPERDMWLVLAGEGPLRAALEQTARDGGVAHRVVFPGFTTRPSEMLSALDVFVMPSRTEGLPLALLEAMACECCPVAMGVGGIGEVMTGPELGWLCPPEDPVAFAEAMRQAATVSREHLADMGRLARAHVGSHFDARTQFAACADAIEASCASR